MIADLIGGQDGFVALAEAFYAEVTQEPILRRLYPKRLETPTESLGMYLCMVFSPETHGEIPRPHVGLRESHVRFRISLAERDAWLRCMDAAIDACRVAEPARSALRDYFRAGASSLVNRPVVADLCACPSGPTDAHVEAARAWGETAAMEELLAAVRRGDGEGAIRLAEGPALAPLLKRSQNVRIAALGRLGTCDEKARDYVTSILRQEPALVNTRHGHGWTLLFEAAGRWCLPFVGTLLSMGADPNMPEDQGHPPLYAVGNSTEGVEPERGAATVRALVAAGADVNVASGVKRCTALHMAARRGNAKVAAALIEAGAELEARDSDGDTPLRRAVNCGKAELAALLVRHGARADSVGSRGLTPLTAARDDAMRAAVRGSG